MEAQADVRVPSRGRSFPHRLSGLGDERLARLVGAGSERAFATLYERYHQPLYRYCLSMLRNDADAQDALQSTFAGALVALRRGQRKAPLRPWLYRIAHNESISLLRRRRSEDELSEASEPATASVADVAEERARLGLLMADLRELPERQRGALVMRELSGLSHEDVALALGITVGAAKQTMFEARRSLMEFSEGRAMACEAIRRIISDCDGRALRGRRIRAHLRDCPGCAAFAAAIPTRSADLRALAPPLPAVAAAGLLARIAGVGSGHGAGGAVAAGAGKSVGMAVSAKALTGVALIATAAAGVTAVLHHSAHPARTSAPAHAIRSGPGSSARTPPAPGGPGGPASGGRAAKRSGAGLKHRTKRANRRTTAGPAGSSSAATARRAPARSLTQVRVRPSRGSAHENHRHQNSRVDKHEKHRKHEGHKKHENRHIKSDALKRDRARMTGRTPGSGVPDTNLRTEGTP